MTANTENNFTSTLSQLISECDIDTSDVEFTPQQRSVRIHGHSTTIRLESAFWAKLEIIADTGNISVPSLITTIHDHCPDLTTRNLASCLRVFCLKFDTMGK